MTAGEGGEGVTSGNGAGSSSLDGEVGSYACVGTTGTSAFEGELTVEIFDVGLEGADLPLLFAATCPKDCDFVPAIGK